MTDEGERFARRMQELSRRAEGYFTFSDFLTLGEQTALGRLKLATGYALWGGGPECERRMAAFGEEEQWGYGPEWPIRCIRVSPRSRKFAEEMTHRDVLGSLLGLGLDRRNVGDIFLSDNVAYLFCAEHLAPFITENLTRVGRTDVDCAECEPDPELLRPHLTERDAVCASRRADAVVCGVFRLSRSEGSALIARGLVQRNGEILQSTSAEVADGDVISVRGQGRFRVEETTGSTGSGRLHVRVSIYG